MALPQHRVAVIDPTPLLRCGLRSFLKSQPDLRPTIEAGSPSEALPRMKTERPDLIICELLFSGDETIFDFIKQLHRQIGRIPLLVFSHFNERLLANRVLHAGAQGFLMKSASESQLKLAIRQLLSGKGYLSRDMTERTIRSLSEPDQRVHDGEHLRDLTNRELQVLDLIGSGLSSKETAATLHISLKTVETHRSHIRSKLSIDNCAELICFASQWRGLAAPSSADHFSI